MNQYCLYLRKSRADIESEAHGEGETLARHENILLSLANRSKLDIGKIYREIVSGETISSRPVMQELLREVEDGLWDGVLVTEIERLARGDTIDQGIVAQAFKNSNTKIITPTKTYDPNNEFDEEYFEFGLFMSRREYKTINRRMQAGKLASAKEGKYVPGIPPYGYRRVKLENQKGYTLEIIPEEADVIRLIFDLYTKDGLGITSIINRLTQLNLKPNRSDVWGSTSIRKILRNPVYIGKITWNYKKTVKKSENNVQTKKRIKTNDCILIDGLHKPIITINQWEAAQSNIEKKHIPVPIEYQQKNPLAGLVICAKCGKKMVRHTPKAIPVLICENPTCDNVSSAIPLVEEAILYSLEELLEEYSVIYENKKRQPTIDVSVQEKSLKKCINDLEKLKVQLNNVYTLLEQGTYTSEEFVERSQYLKSEQSKLLTVKSELETELDNYAKMNDSKALIIPKLQEVLDTYNMLETVESKNNLLKEVLDKVEYNKPIVNRRTTKFNVTLFPKILLK